MSDFPTTVEQAEGASPQTVPYSPTVAERICRHYAEGLSLTKIAALGEMPPYATILRWVHEHTGFKLMFDSAKTARALHLENLAQETAEEVYRDSGERDRVAAGRLKVETYFRVAEVNDPSRYGKKITHAGDAGRPIVFQVNTGFPEPNEFHRPPKLGADGLIERAAPVVAEVLDGTGPDSPEEAGRAHALHDGGGLCAAGEGASSECDPGSSESGGAESP